MFHRIDFQNNRLSLVNSTVYPGVVNTTGEVQSGPTVTSPFVSSTFSPLYGNPNQGYVFNVTLNSTAGVDVTPTVWVVDANGNMVSDGEFTFEYDDSNDVDLTDKIGAETIIF